MSGGAGHASAQLADGFTGVVSALHDEACCLAPTAAAIGARAERPGLKLYLSGVGLDRAESACRALLEEGAEALLSWGTCGALQPGLGAGDLILPRQICVSDGATFTTDAAWRQRLCTALPERLQPASQASLYSGPQILATPQQKAERAATGAVAVDMESAAVARAALQAGIPLLVVRVVVDAADRRLPQLAMDGVDAIGRAHWAAFLPAAARRPWQVFELASLGSNFKRALQTLCAIAACGELALAGAVGHAPH